MNVARQCIRNTTGRQNLHNILLLLALLFTSFFSIAQVERIYKPRQVIDMGNGRKVEIIRCRGEGPLEECDVISYTTKRQQGTRSWENVNRLHEEELAAATDRHPQTGINQLTTGTAGVPMSLLKQERKSPVNDSVINAIKQYRARTDEAVPVTHNTGFATVGSARHAALQNEAKRLDSLSRASEDTFKLALQRELQRADSLEKAAGNKPENSKQDSGSGRLNGIFYKRNHERYIAFEALLAFNIFSYHSYFDKLALSDKAIYRSITRGN